MLLKLLKPNPDNPRVIKDENFQRLVKKLLDNPDGMRIRPILVNNPKELLILAGNQRSKALQHLGYTEIPDEWIAYADTWPDEVVREFILTDNMHDGEFLPGVAASVYGYDFMLEQGVILPATLSPVEVNFEEQAIEAAEQKFKPTKTSIQIEFPAARYPEALAMFNAAKESGIDISKVLIKIAKQALELA